ncbi:MAG: hypothetical protein AABY09_02040, partial [Nanoarchaeota archaeon]
MMLFAGCRFLGNVCFWIEININANDIGLFMSLVPKPLPSVQERCKWLNVPAGLEGAIVKSLDELEALFPKSDEDSEMRVLEDNAKYIVYGREKLGYGLVESLAYQCKNCSQIIVGMPVIHDDTSIGLNLPLAGREGYDMYCSKCF